MRLTEEQQQVIADRLGITKPEQPQEVAEYLSAWDNYEEAISNYQTERLSTWDKTPERIRANAEAISKMRNDLKHIWQLGETIETFTQTTKLATKAWSDAQRSYIQAIETEAERPQREFERAKRTFIEALEKEQRSLKYRMSRFRGWNTPAEEEYKAWSARYDLLSYLISEARYIDATPEAPIFTEEAILERVLENEYRVSNVLANLALVAEAVSK